MNTSTARHGTAVLLSASPDAELNVSVNNATTPEIAPKEAANTDVNTDDLECWWSELKLYTPSFLHERFLAREGKDGRVVGAGQCGVVVWSRGIHYADCRLDRGPAETLVSREMQIPSESVAGSSWNQKIIVLEQTRLGQNQFQRQSLGFNFGRTAVGSSVMFTTHTGTCIHIFHSPMSAL